MDGFKNYEKRKELTSEMLKEVDNIRKKYNIDNLKISMQDLTDFEKKLLGNILEMIFVLFF